VERQLGLSGPSIVSDLVNIQDADEYTDSAHRCPYRLPLAKKGEIPLDVTAVTAIRLPDESAFGPAVVRPGVRRRELPGPNGGR